MKSIVVLTSILLVLLCVDRPAKGANLIVNIDNPKDVTMVGVFNRWDIHGNRRRSVNTRAKIGTPEVHVIGTQTGKSTWVFENLPEGTYDLVVIKKGRLRIEGWTYPPIIEFDPFFPSDSAVEDSVRKLINDDISKSRYYENKVTALEMGSNKKTVRALVMLLRDKPTTYRAGVGTLRFEIWQYTWRYGGWQKQRRTKVLHRILDQVGILRQWTWVWEPSFGGIKVGKLLKTLDIKIPNEDRQTVSTHIDQLAESSRSSAKPHPCCCPKRLLPKKDR